MDGSHRPPARSKRGRLQRSERVFSESLSSHLTSWEVFVRDSLLTLAWPDLLNVVSGSTASDLISRRGVFSRRYYGSVEQLQQQDADGQENQRRFFRIENGDSLGEKDEMFGSPTTPVLENPEYQTRWYFKYFLGKLHQNYVGMDIEKLPFFLSVVINENSNQYVPLYRAILFKKSGAHKISLPYTQQKLLTIKQILSNFPNMEKLDKGPKEIFAPDVQKDLLLLEEQEGSVNFKFGVIYMKKGQATDDEVLSNEFGSESFDRFLNLLGERIRLRGFSKFRGGLDTKGDMTGKYSVHTIYEGHEIMFHVSTMLPFSRDNKQQVERKRHIGNDIVNIVFIDAMDSLVTQNLFIASGDRFDENCTIIEDIGAAEAIIAEDQEPSTSAAANIVPQLESDHTYECNHDRGNQQGTHGAFLHGTSADTNFNPTCIRSQFTHIFAVVTREKENRYRLSVFSDEAVPLFGPSLPCPPVFDDARPFRDFLLVKLINGEKATFETPTFAKKRERTLDMLIRDLYAEHTDARFSNGKTMLNRRAFSDVLAETPRYSRLKEDTRQIEFIRIGQALKLEAIMRGDAPTSLASAGSDGSVFKRTPWEANCFYPCFPGVQTINAADSWADNSLIIATDEGVFAVEDGTSHRLIFDRTLQVRQLNVVEPHGILLLRAGQSNRECKVYVFRLSELEKLSEQSRSRTEVKGHRMERTRGTHLYSLSKTGSKLRMCVAIGRRVTMFQWKHSAAWTAWCPSSDTDTIEGFNYLWEVALSENPSLITILDSGWSPNSPSHGDILLCVGYKHHWDIVNGRTGYAYQLHSAEGAKPHLVTALDLYEDQEVQLLLCYNHTCHFQKIDEENTKSKTDFDFHWNTVPTDIVCAFPYIIGFTNECMEIRLIVNGNLVHTMTMPKLQLVAAKNDIFFATTAPDFFPNKNDTLVVDTRSTEILNEKTSPPSSPQHSSPEPEPLRIYRIPIHALSKNNTQTISTKTDNTAPNTSSQLLDGVSGTNHSNPNLSLHHRSGSSGIGLYYASGSTSNGSADTPSTPPPLFSGSLTGGSTVAWKSSDSKLAIANGSAGNSGSGSSCLGNSLCVDPQPRVSRSATNSPVPPIKGIIKHINM